MARRPAGTVERSPHDEPIGHQVDSRIHYTAYATPVYFLYPTDDAKWPVGIHLHHDSGRTWCRACLRANCDHTQIVRAALASGTARLPAV